MGISDTVKRAALAWVRATEDAMATEVTGFSDRTEDRGYHSTCRYTQALVDVTYRSPNEAYYWGKTATYEGGFAEFIRMLDQYDTERE